MALENKRRLDLLLDRTNRLHALTARMSAALRGEEIAEIVIEESAVALNAHSAAIWTVDQAGKRLVLERARNYPEAALALVRSMPLEMGRPVTDAVLRREPIWMASRSDYEARYPESSARTASLSPSMYGVAAVPLLTGSHVHGVLALTFLGGHEFDDDEQRFLTMLALHCAQGLERARLHQAETTAREAAEAATERATFLARASAVLAGSLDYEETLRNVAALAVPRIGDWCGVELVDEKGEAKQVAVAHVDPEKVQLARDLRIRYPPDPDAPAGVPNILKTGKSELYPEIPDHLLVTRAVDAEHLRIMRELGLSSAIAVPIRDRGEIVGVLSFVSATRSRRYTEADLLMAEQLAERAGAAIGNARLYAAAKAATQLRDDFLAVAGHELRTPLSALKLHLETQLQVRDGIPLERLRDRAGKMLIQVERLVRLVEDLLDVSKMTGGRLELEIGDCDLAEVVRDVIERVRDEAERAHCELILEADVVRGQWDRGRIDQVVMNLMTNAIKYGKGHPIAIRVTANGTDAVLGVRDQGIGIAKEDQERIFQRFERAVSSRNFGGLGLGLWITRHLVELHRGSIEVDSSPAAGATFTVILPRGTGSS